MERDDAEAAQPWRLRAPLLAGVGIVAAVLVQQLTLPDRPAGAPFPRPAIDEWRIALATTIAVAAIGFGLVAERTRLAWSVAFALAVGIAAGLIRYWSGGGPDGFWFADWRYASLALALGVATPLFQTARDEGRWRFPYPVVHAHAWTDAVLWFAGWAFTGIVFGLAWLLAELFELIGIKALSQLLDHSWFSAALLGAALGGGLGLLRERDRVVRLLQRVVTTVLAVLAPVLGAGLVLFLLALPFTGLHALWEATRSTTPILLTCVVGALLLANAVIGADDAEELGNPALRLGALALGAAALPLAVIAAVATGLRIAQYGITPDRLWAVVFVALACAYGLAYLIAAARRRLGWAGEVRGANLRLAFAVAGIALVLATPIVSFNRLSADAQVARLEAGRIAPERFDWAALAFDYGDPGKRALARLRRSHNAGIARLANEAAGKTNRWAVDSVEEATRRQQARVAVQRRAIVVHPSPAPVPLNLREIVFGDDIKDVWDSPGDTCSAASAAPCQLFWTPGQDQAIVLQDECSLLPAARRSDPRHTCHVRVAALRWRRGRWEHADPPVSAPPKLTPSQERASLAEERRAVEAGDVTIREVRRRQLFVGGKPVGAPFE